jgi:L-methionine (R)-S-oxide reductase
MVAISEIPDQAWLETFLRAHGGVAGTVHRLSEGELRLTAAANIPPPVQQIVQTIPRGKGMAGLAWEHNEPISTCNIQTDDTGRVRPGAKMIGAQAGVALPVRDGQGQVRAVVGIAYAEERTLLESELAALQAAAATLSP